MSVVPMPERKLRAEWVASVYEALESQGKTKKQLAEAIGVSIPNVYCFAEKFPSKARRIAICEFLKLPPPPEFKNHSPNALFSKQPVKGGRPKGSKNKKGLKNAQG